MEAQKAREAALQKEISTLRAELLNRIVYSTDFKRRPHYNQTLDLTNAQIEARIRKLNAELESAAATATP